MLDWSYNLLPGFEQKILRRLSVFSGYFTLEAVREVVCDDDNDQVVVFGAVGSLVAKSLAAAEPTASVMRYRLLDSAQVYAKEKLLGSGDAEDTFSRHVKYLTSVYAQSSTGQSVFFRKRDTSSSVENLGDLRVALDWAFSNDDHADIAVMLAAASVSTFLELSLLVECRKWSERALQFLSSVRRGGITELSLQEAWAISSMFAIGNGSTVLAAIERGLDLAREVGSLPHELRLLAGLNVFRTRIGGVFPDTLAITQRTSAIARQLGEPAAIAIAEWMHGVACHLTGDLVGAELSCEAGLISIAKAQISDTILFGYDHQTRALFILARTHWLLGRADTAVQVAWQGIDGAERLQHPTSICISLIYISAVFTWRGDWATSERLIEKLIAHAQKYRLGPYQAVALGLKGELLVKKGIPEDGVPLLYECLDALRTGQHRILNSVFVSALASGLVALGNYVQANAVLEEVFPINLETFDAAEILRIKGAILIGQSPPAVDEGRQYLLDSISAARTQGSLGWELRAAITLSKLLYEEGSTLDASALLAGVLDRMGEGAGTADHVEAVRLLHLYREN